jgi:hypothetical protein
MKRPTLLRHLQTILNEYPDDQKNPSKVKKMKKEKDYQQGRARKKERKRRANNKLFP